MQKQLDGCIVWNTQNTVFDSRVNPLAERRKRPLNGCGGYYET